MAPPGVKGGKDLVVAVGVGKPKGPKPPGVEDDMPEQKPEAGAKATREKAMFVSEEHHCGKCMNYDQTSGDCSKVEGMFEAEDACLRYFEEAGGEDHEEPDEDDMGGPSDNDADNMPNAE